MSDVSLLPAGPEYREVPDCPGYMAGSDGVLWSCWTKGRWPRRTSKWWRVKGTPTTQGGHLRVVLRTAAGFRVTDFLHRVILTTFVGPCPDGMISCHDPDHNPANNAVGNLRWATPTANMDDCKKHGRFARGDMMPTAKLHDNQVIEVFRLRKAGWTHDAIAEKFSIGRLLVTKVLSRKRYAHVAVDEADLPKRAVGRHVMGEKHYRAKLTEQVVREIRTLRASGWTQRKIAEKIGVGQETVQGVLAGRNWAHVE